MSAPRTQAARIRDLDQAKERNTRMRLRKREGYAGAGPVDVPHELVLVMIETGDIDAGHVIKDGNIQRVSREVMAEAWPRFLERLAAKVDDLPELLSGDEERLLSNPLFRQEIGLPSALRQSVDVVARALDCAGYRLAVKKKKRPD